MHFLNLAPWTFHCPLSVLQLQEPSPSYPCNVLFPTQAQADVRRLICQILSRLSWLQEIKLLLQALRIVSACLSGNNAMSWMPDLPNQNPGFTTHALCRAWLALHAHATHRCLNKLPSSRGAIKPLCLISPSLPSRLVIAESHSTCTDNIPNRILCRKEEQDMECILLSKTQ